MKCEDYREAVAAQPSAEFDGADHAESCAACAEFRDEMLALDAKIARALDIPIPALTLPELPAIDDESNVVNLPFHRRKIPMSTPAWFGMAASIALATVLGAFMFGDHTNYESLGAEIIAHLEHEPEAMQVSDYRVSEQRLDRVVRANVAEVDSDALPISYAKSCVINGREVPHIVFQGENGPVTLLLLPDEEIEESVELNGKGVRGYLIKNGSGSIAILSDRVVDLDNTKKKVMNSVKWRT